MDVSIDSVRGLLHQVSEALSLKLSEVLEHYIPNPYMTEQLEEFLPAWGDKTLHEFLEHIKTLDPNVDGPDVLNGEMEPLNIFWVLFEFYPDKERTAPP